MTVFFGLTIAVGLALAWNRNDDVWFESIWAGERGVGVLLIVVGVIGLLCVRLWP